MKRLRFCHFNESTHSVLNTL